MIIAEFGEFIGREKLIKAMKKSFLLLLLLYCGIYSYAQDELSVVRDNLSKLLTEAKASGYEVSKFQNVLDDENSTIDELQNTIDRLNTSLELTEVYGTHGLNDIKVLYEPSGTDWYAGDNAISFSSDYGEMDTITAYFNSDTEVFIYYQPICEFALYIDGDSVISQDSHNNWIDQYAKFVHKIGKGIHKVEWISEDPRIANISVVSAPTITVNLLQPGSLGTEILYNVNHVKDVRQLKIVGAMNDADWEIIDMMANNLFSLDLSEAKISKIKDRQFQAYEDWIYLHEIKLPEGLESIGERAFYKSNIAEIKLPSTLLSIGNGAFEESKIKSVNIPDAVKEIGTDAFYGCRYLEQCVYGNGLNVIPNECFRYCHRLTDIQYHDNITNIGESAFYECYKLKVNDLPSQLTSIGYNAFRNCLEIDSIVVPDKVTNISEGAFRECANLVYAELPVSYYNLNYGNKWIFVDTALKDLYLKSSTVITYTDISDNAFWPTSLCSNIANVTLHVPDYLVNAYKLDKEWYNYGNIVGFDTEDIDEWTIGRDLVLNARDRLRGTPSVIINETGSMIINGTDGMPLDNLKFSSDPDNNLYGRLISNVDYVTVAGELGTTLRFGTKNRWYYFSYPYDIKVSDIQYINVPAKCAIRYYDGASRAANGATGSWKNYSAEDIIPAGTGFIMMVSEAGWWNFPSQDNASKQYLTSYKMFAKELALNDSEVASDKGWNLVGNPYQSWYNIHKLNFTAPITVRNVSNNTYEAYSIIDDDYALAPNQVFFVQCPDGTDNISFPLDGRQMTSVIEDANASKPHGAPATADRRLTDLTVSDGTNSDRTRIVLNDKATLSYDMMCDASKFMSEAKVAQIYSLDNEGNQYAINERPEADGIVKLGFTAPASGCFTIAITRNTVEDVVLVDNQLQQSVNLTSQDYSFASDAGTFLNRFELRMASTPTGITDIDNAAETTVSSVAGGIIVEGFAEVYNMSGIKVSEGSGNINLSNGNYIVKANGKVYKMVVM